MLILVLFGTLFLFIFLGVPIGISIGLSTLLATILSEGVSVSTVAQQAFTSLNSFTIMAIPFFMFAGILMGKGGVSRRLLEMAQTIVGWITGGLAMVTVLTSMFFAAISGSGPATVAAIGSFMIPEMKSKRYGNGFSSAITAAAGSIGVIIPPSIPFILYAVSGNVSIGDLFIAGILPGILIGVLLMITSYIILKRNPDVEVNKERASFKEVIKKTYDAKWALLAPIIVLGGIYAGIVTPTEASVIAVIYAFVAGGLIHRELRIKEIYDSFIETITLMGATLYMIGLSVAFAYLLTIEQVPTTIATYLTNVSDNPIVILILINIFLLIVGAFIDIVASIVILTPVLLPIAIQIGLDPIHFGVIMVANLAIGYVTPPIGVNLFVASAVGKASIPEISRASLPIYIALLICLIIITFYAPLSTILIN